MGGKNYNNWFFTRPVILSDLVFQERLLLSEFYQDFSNFLIFPLFFLGWDAKLIYRLTTHSMWDLSEALLGGSCLTSPCRELSELEPAPKIHLYFLSNIFEFALWNVLFYPIIGFWLTFYLMVMSIFLRSRSLCHNNTSSAGAGETVCESNFWYFFPG